MRHRYNRMDRPRECTVCGFEEHDGSGIGWIPCTTPDQETAGGDVELRYALQYARNLIGPDEVIDAALSTPAPQPSDVELFDLLRDQSWDLRCFDYPTGGDDRDIGWRVIGHWDAEPKERVVAEVHEDDPKAAILAAILAQGAVE